MPEAGPDKPAILQESHFVVEEGILHRAFRTGAIWLNKLFFSSAALWLIWLLVAYFQGLEDCGGGIGHVGNNSTSDLPIVAEGTCSPLLTTTSKYLGGMTLMSFLGSILLGLAGLVAGKRIVEVTPTAMEPGAEERAGTAAYVRPDHGDVDGAGAGPGGEAGSEAASGTGAAGGRDAGPPGP